MYARKRAKDLPVPTSGADFPGIPWIKKDLYLSYSLHFNCLNGQGSNGLMIVRSSAEKVDRFCFRFTQPKP